MVKPPWGINWQRYHADQQDMPHIAAMGYRAFTTYEWMWSNRDFADELLSVARSDALFLNRDHPKSEEKDDWWRSDPAGKGRAHADDWAQKVREGRVYTPLDRTFFLGLNEPDSNQYQRQIDAYNEAYCRRMAQHGLRAAAYSFGVGHPSSVGLRPDTLPDWSHYAASAAAVLEGRHIAAFHEYGAPHEYGWDYWCNRSRYCPYPFDAVLDETGIDHGVLKAGDLAGWMRSLKPEEYVTWLDGFQVGMAERANTRKVNILAYNIFSFDHGSGETKDWHSFDIRPIRAGLERYPWRHGSSPSNPQQPQVYIPVAQTPGGGGHVSSNWERAIAWVLKWEGGFQANPADLGNYYQGRLIGTKYGISAASWAHQYDIPTLTVEQAKDIYYQHYWLASGADKYAWPLCLAHFDTAVNAGVGRAKEMLEKSEGDFLAYMGHLISWYTRIDGFEHFGRAWIRRRAEILLEAAK